jgi:hypothetical protein
VAAHEAGDRLSEDELVAMIFLLLVASHETTVNLIGNGVLALLEHPDQMERLRDDPGMIRPAVEEFLRYDSPVHLGSERYAREEVTIGGVTIVRGEMVHPLLGSANRDERQFVRPDDLDIAREPNRHVAFGQGVHYCLGAALARLEGQIAIDALVRRMPELRLTVPRPALRRRPGMGLHGLEALPAPCPPAAGRALERSWTASARTGPSTRAIRAGTACRTVIPGRWWVGPAGGANRDAGGRTGTHLVSGGRALAPVLPSGPTHASVIITCPAGVKANRLLGLSMGDR